ncbi:2-C-methyl-D-erythritol 4-phosphate cytidylyltransferase [Renibacterium salmoninarum ATCC 33209]|uniref:2-C-methyl-D-erythritol 4-phosphate cytidylyltransferase n=1 Tax=Renibacterium salmoninarum (strain ATCC 33209 / DSM 20767 / JCM 11484 / NBRC 15589 / NCIMB 2235) TaxID=288705 RepID=A9WLY2_RENSM|nr:2-C-methyl-D-erythritol 4-phosphate cytidylyltransferase [Renibacterium salmoninarum]ABY22163.1 2-C-methyl-D-erythritol 4-phosphate cytidylyltransferase [Renibacterium salmoninarum ATCC 33209]
MNYRDEIRVAVIVVAAGSGERLGQGQPKAQAALGSEPLLVHALRGVLAAHVAEFLCVVVPRGDVELRAVCARIDPSIRTVDGGSTRSDSVSNALAVLPANIDAVLVHDAARPLTPEEVFHRVRNALEAGAQAVIPALAVVDTIKTAQPSTEREIAPEQVHTTPQRDVLRAVQTPQGFDLATLRAAHEAASMFNDAQAAAITDDAMLVESQGVPVYIVRGSELSLKITTPIDLLIAEAMLEGPAAPRWVEG